MDIFLLFDTEMSIKTDMLTHGRQRKAFCGLVSIVCLPAEIVWRENGPAADKLIS